MDNMIDNNIPLLNRALVVESSPKWPNLNKNVETQTLPKPSNSALSHSDTLHSLIIETIESKTPKMISFAEYMHFALFSPGLGYYSAGNQKFGSSGDFVTGPEISSLFSGCIAKQCYQGLSLLGKDTSLFEIGAGSGQMAADILKELQDLECLPKKYYILELSAELKERQQKTLKSLSPELFTRIEWLEKLPENPLKGIILANEVCDAMPVHRFYIEKTTIFELGVTHLKEKFCLVKMTPDEELENEIKRILPDFDPILTENQPYSSEINLNIKPWIKSLSETLETGLIFIIDYGFPRREYYHPSRMMGTLMCHYRHYAHHDPFLYPGLQDITAHVDFTLIAEAALNAHLNVLGFTNQAAFLLGSGILTLAEKAKQNGMPEEAFFKQNQAIQILTSPAEMGEAFKVIALSKGLELETKLIGFSLNDMRYRL